MQLEKNRHIQIALHLMHNQRMVTSEELAELTRASTRTIKTDIVFVNDVLKQHGAEILSKKSEGYYLHVLEEIAYETYKNELEIINLYFVRYGGNQYLMYILRTTEILRNLLSTNEYISIDELAEQMYVSRSTIKQDLPQVKKLLASYHLTLDSKPNYGLKVIGKEYHYRMAMMCCSGLNVPSFRRSIKEERYIRQVYAPDYQEIQNLVLELLRKYPFRIKHNSARGLGRILMIMRSRIEADYGHIYFDEKTKSELDCFTEQKKFTAELFDRLSQYEGFDVSEDERYYITMYLIAYHDYKGSEINRETMHFLYDDIIEMYKNACRFIVNRLGLEDNFETTQQQLLFNVSRIVVRNHFDMLPYNHLNYGNGYEAVKDNPVAINLASRMAAFFEEQLHCKLNTKDTLYLAHYFDELLHRIPFEYEPMRLVTVSGIGRNYSSNIIEYIQNSYGHYVKSNQAMELYELQGLKPEDADLVVVDNLDYELNHPFLLATVSHRDLSSVEKALKKSYLLTDLCAEIAKMTRVYQNFEFMGQEDCFRILSYKYGVDEYSVTQMLQAFERSEERISYGHFGFALLMADRRYVQRNCFDIYQLKGQMEWGEKYFVKYILFLSSDFSVNLKMMKAFSYLITSLYENSEMINALAESDKRAEVIEEAILKQIRLI